MTMQAKATDHQAGKRHKESTSASLHRQLLFPDWPNDEPIPLLVPGKEDDVQQLNESLFHLIALALRAYVLTWLPRITQDRTLLPIITRDVLTPILRPILEHISTSPTSLIDLLLFDLPSIIECHIETFHSSSETVALSITPDVSTVEAAYHARLPLNCVDLDPVSGRYTVSSTWLNTVSDQLIRLYLPLEGYQVDSERIMLQELLGRIILGGIARRLCEPWFWWTMGLKIHDRIGRRNYQQASSPQGIFASVLSWSLGFWTGLVYLWQAVIWLTLSVAGTPQRHPKYRHCLNPTLSMVRTICDPLPWTGRAAFGVIELVLTFFAPMLDRLIPHVLQEHLLTKAMALRLVTLLQDVLFPMDGYPSPSAPDPSEEETTELRRRLQSRTAEVLRISRTNWLDPISDPGCNAHLVGMVYSSALAAVLPNFMRSPVLKGMQ